MAGATGPLATPTTTTNPDQGADDVNDKRLAHELDVTPGWGALAYAAGGVRVARRDT